MIPVSNGRISKKQGRMDRWEEGRKEYQTETLLG